MVEAKQFFFIHPHLYAPGAFARIRRASALIRHSASEEAFMLIYIHVPFCQSRCSYCAFQSMPLQGEARPDREKLFETYLQSLDAEIALQAKTLAGKEAHSVFFGGGTPSLLSGEAFARIMGSIKKHFSLSAKAEITLEANPESMRDHAKLQAYLAAGANRISIGLQSLDDGALRMLGRPHKAHEGLRAIDLARSAGFGNISVDLMWGLPGQSVHQWLQTLKEVAALGPDHISTYGLTLEPGTALERQCENGSLILPPERDQSIMFMEGAATLEAAGYMHYEISNFARMGFQCRHNLGYWEGMDYLGLGPSSTSTIGGRRWTNPASLAAWTESVQKGGAGRNVEILTPSTRALELIMLRLRTARGMRLKAYQDFCGRDFLQDNKRLMQALHENGLIRIRKGYLSLTRSGMLVSNSIISNLFDRMQKTLAENPPILNARPASGRKAGRLAAPTRDSAEITPVKWPDA